MNFNNACNDNSKSNFDVLDNMFRRAGYVRPQIVFWNVNGKIESVPTGCDESGVSLISGFSIDILKAVLGDKVITPSETMHAALDVERYAGIRLAE